MLDFGRFGGQNGVRRWSKVGADNGRKSDSKKRGFFSAFFRAEDAPTTNEERSWVLEKEGLREKEDRGRPYEGTRALDAQTHLKRGRRTTTTIVYASRIPPTHFKKNDLV